MIRTPTPIALPNSWVAKIQPLLSRLRNKSLNGLMHARFEPMADAQRIAGNLNSRSGALGGI